MPRLRLAPLFFFLLAAASPPPSVTVTSVRLQDANPGATYIGHVEAIQSVQIVARVTAFIEKQPVPQGSMVKAGRTVIELETAQYAAAVLAAQAQLDSANAALRNAQRAFERASQLVGRGFTAQADLDQATATRDQDQANVLAAQANLASARLNLGYCTMTSPIDGRIGVWTLTPGNLVTPSTPALTTVNQIDPIRVEFAVSDRDLVNVQQRAGNNVAELTAKLVIRLVLPNGTEYGQTGRIAFLGNAIDPATGTIGVFAEFANPDALLVPGAYATVNVRTGTSQQRPMVPIAAIQTTQSGSFVLTVGPDNKVEQRQVALGQQVGQDYVVREGLSGGERVIVAGLQKVRPGDVVAPQETPASQAGG